MNKKKPLPSFLQNTSNIKIQEDYDKEIKKIIAELNINKTKYQKLLKELEHEKAFYESMLNNTFDRKQSVLYRLFFQILFRHKTKKWIYNH